MSLETFFWYSSVWIHSSRDVGSSTSTLTSSVFIPILFMTSSSRMEMPPSAP